MDEKHDFEFDHFQVEVGAHIWWLSSPHEYFEMVEYEGDSSLASGRTGNRVFLHQHLIFPYVIYMGNFGFSSLFQLVEPLSPSSDNIFHHGLF